MSKNAKKCFFASVLLSFLIIIDKKSLLDAFYDALLYGFVRLFEELLYRFVLLLREKIRVLCENRALIYNNVRIDMLKNYFVENEGAGSPAPL